MAKIQLFFFICGCIATAVNAIDLWGTITSAKKSGLFDMILSSSVKRPIRVRTLDEVNRRSGNEFVILDFIGLIEQYDGYTAEEYKVQTDDGYILGLHRITESPKSPQADNKRVVYIAHGMTGSSDVMVDLGPQRSIAFELADAGYDVWLGNVRGNSHSRTHIEISPDDDSDFWDFSMDEAALIDTSKLIDFALEKSKQAKLTYVGYSMGTALSYMLLSEKPEYNQKINLVINLAPAVVFLDPLNLKLDNLFIGPIKMRAFWTANPEVLPQSGEITAFAKSSCTSEDEASNSCTSFLSQVTNIKKINLSDITTILTYAPAGTSINIIKHYRQLLMANGTLRKYNPAANGEGTMPEYDLSKVTVPNVLLYAKNDFFVKVEEAEYLKNKLSNVAVFEAIADDEFNHLDFILSTEAKTLVYDRVLKIMSELLK